MSYQSDIYAALTGNSPLAAVVSTRIYPEVAPGNATVPYVVYQTISTGGETTHDGARTWDSPTIQFTVWAKTKALAISTAALLRAVLDGKTLSGSSACSLVCTNILGNYDPDSKLFGEVAEFRATAKPN